MRGAWQENSQRMRGKVMYSKCLKWEGVAREGEWDSAEKGQVRWHRGRDKWDGTDRGHRDIAQTGGKWDGERGQDDEWVWGAEYTGWTYCVYCLCLVSVFFCNFELSGTWGHAVRVRTKAEVKDWGCMEMRWGNKKFALCYTMVSALHYGLCITLWFPHYTTITEPPFNNGPPFDNLILQAQFFTKFLDSFFWIFLSCIIFCFWI